MAAIEAITPRRQPAPLRPVAPAPAAVQSAVNENDAVSWRIWLAVLGSSLGAFLAVLNIQIVNSSLADIQGAIGAGIDDGGWISTSYLVTEIIVIPLSAWLSRVFSLRRYLLTSTVLFLLFSVACAFAGNLGEMIVLRAFQGFFGGVLIPLAFTIVMTMLPKSRQPVGMALYAFSAVFAPAIGPTIGGYLNETFGWQTVFFVNLVPGAAMVAMLYISLPREKMQLGLLRQGDWPGIVTMAIGLGALETVLEEGNKNDWLGSPYILRLAAVAAVSLVAFIVIELTAERPLLDLRLLTRRNFGLGTLAGFLLGIALYGASFVLPLYLSQVQGYNAMQIGEVLAWVGLPQLLIIPLLPQLMARVNTKLLMAAGLILFAISNFMNIYLTGDVSGPQMIVSNVVRAVGQALLMTPLSALAVAGIARESAGTASALFNMMRNLGGAVGIAVLQTVLTKREQFHSSVLTENVSMFDAATRARLDGLTQYFMAHGIADQAMAWHKAVVAVGLAVRRQATIMAYGDAFFLMGAAIVLALAAVAWLKRTAGATAEAAGH
ncbi:MAG TPA: MDR family MFS transporter [Stellaceae bacterium]|nr:MDR family MFS transporter [Stellaceae bacterium]